MLTYKKTFRNHMAVKLKQYRHTHKLSQETMSEYLRISPRSYVDIEHGRYGMSAHTLVMFMLMMSDTEVLQLIDELEEIASTEAEEQ
ncbi:MAG: helix-turn-helix transcriptional regulator [Butyricicoccus porcorum]|uniref:helix-turn-helix transcriptional regulator n=1 Tax=Butyricicoccus porcorum TaxID=1945634 RepID=UPI003F17BD8B